MFLSCKKILCAAVCASAMFPIVALYGETPASQPASTTIEFPISARALAKPDLDYSLMPRVEDTDHGNAVIHYHIAIELMQKPGTGTSLAGIENYEDKLDEQQKAPLAALDETLIKKMVDMQHSALHELDNGARCDRDEWESSLRQDGMMALLPYLGSLRQLSRVLALGIRLDIKNHHWTEARQKLQTGYTLAHQLGDADTLIDSLVGLAICGLMNECVEDWVRDPASPNLYWPLVNLPHPFNSLQKPMNNERSFVYFSFPQMHEMREGKFSAQQWIDFIHGFSKLGFLTDGDVFHMADYSTSLDRNAAGTAAAIVLYPTAKKFLMDRGMSAVEVECLPVAAAVGKYFERSYAEASDTIYKWNGVPAYQSQYAQTALVEAKQNPDTNILAKMLLPSLDRARFIGARADRSIDMLRIVEALRDYAAGHHDLPDSLDAIQLPIPIDATSGKPYQYERHGDSATLSSSAITPTATHGAFNGQTFKITLTR